MDGPGLPLGTCVRILGLTRRPELNGRYAVIVEPLQRIDLPERHGVSRQADCYGVMLVTDPDVNGWLRPENAEAIDEYWPSDALVRAIWLNETGLEPPDLRAIAREKKSHRGAE
jgi:hypothetical protein